MADFSFLSDTDDSAVEELLSQAMDSAVLDQVAAINCSGFTDSDLPTHLETRFRKLKSFPATNPTGKNCSVSSSSFNSHHHSVKSPKTQIENELKNSIGSKSESDSLSDEEMEDPVKKKGSKMKPKLRTQVENELKNSVGSKTKSDSLSDDEKKNPVQKKGFNLNPKLGSGRSVSSSTKSSNSSTGNENLSPVKKTPEGKMSSKSKFRGGSFSAFSSTSNSWSSSMESLSPPRRTGCLWCSPKRDSRKKNRENDDWGKVDELLSDLNTFSAKEQRKVLKKAMEEQKKISREAGKIVKWAKQASARMDVSGLELELSDNESLK